MADRHGFRAKWHDYDNAIYFVTICSHEKKHTFGKISDNIFFPSKLGEIIIEHLKSFPGHYENVDVLNSVVMPNHIHLVIAIRKEGTLKIASDNIIKSKIGCLKHPNHDSKCENFHHNSKLATVIGALKAGVSRTAQSHSVASLPIWQSRFHEYIIRDQHGFDMIMNYIYSNVENWDKDCFAK